MHGLAEAQETISPRYDEVFREVQQRISNAGSVGKADIAMLTFWKRLRADTRWVMTLHGRPDSEVREITGPAVLAARTEEVIAAAGRAREMLRPLPGFARGTALASAVLAAASPTRLAVFDKPARRGLQKVELQLADNAPAFYASYMTLIEQCRAEAADAGHHWSARDVDLALYMLGRPPTCGARHVATLTDRGRTARC
jgi:hypothetical protein